MTGAGSPAKVHYPLFSRADLNGFWALFADNLANMIIASSVLKFVFKVPDRDASSATCCPGWAWR